jgi:glycine amidinotransferase
LTGVAARLTGRQPKSLLDKRMSGMDEGSVIHDRPAVASALTWSACPVNSWNEWDPLEEVIVGRLEGAVVPPFHVSVTFNRQRSTSWLHRLLAGRRYPRWMIRRAQTELDNFVCLLEAEGVRVRRPERIDQRRRVRTPMWASRGFCIACPRDSYLVVGDEIIETPTCWRSRYFESDAYRKLFKEYFAGGAAATAARRVV